MTMTDEQIADDLDHGATNIETNGHTKHVAIDRALPWGAAPVCLVGSVFYDLDGNIRTHTAVHHAAAVARHLGLAADTDPDGIAGRAAIDWNNAPERTAAEVIQAMRDTATKLRGDAYRSAPGGGGARSVEAGAA